VLKQLEVKSKVNTIYGFLGVSVIGFSCNMTLEVTFPILMPENVFNLECFFLCVRHMKILLELGDLQGNSNISVIETDNLRHYNFANRNRKSV
jgi:hypothetical protein